MSHAGQIRPTHTLLTKIQNRSENAYPKILCYGKQVAYYVLAYHVLDILGAHGDVLVPWADPM